jgi:DNA-directed RNA polymerase specialized sigma subunit
MGDTGLIKPIDLSEEGKMELEGVMVVAYESFYVACKLLYGEWRVRQLRRDYIAEAKPLRRYPAVGRHFQRLEQITPLVLAGFIRISLNLCRAFYVSNEKNHPTVTFDDYMTEAQMAIWDSMYSFDGSNRFCTYAYGAVKRRLVDFVRDEERMSGISRGVRKLRTKVKELMSKQHLSFEEAITVAADMEEVDEVVLEQLRDAMYFMTELNCDKAHPEASEPQESPEIQAMREAVATTGLSDLERELIEAHLRGDRGYQAEMARIRINPNTERLYTKMRLSQIFHEACNKLRAAYHHGEDVEVRAA